MARGDVRICHRAGQGPAEWWGFEGFSMSVAGYDWATSSVLLARLSLAMLAPGEVAAVADCH